MGADFPEKLESFLQKHRRIILLLIFLAVACLYISTCSNELGGNLGGDNARYIMLARSIAAGEGYRDTCLPGEPAHVKYPFVFPALLAPFTFLEKYEFLAMHLLISGLAVFVPFFLYGWLRAGKFSITFSMGLLITLAVIPRYFGYLLHILSEIPFMFLVYLSLFLLSRARGRISEAGAGHFTAIFIISMLAFFTRTIGVCLIAGIFVELVINPGFRRRRLLRVPWPILFLVCFLLAYGAWSVRNQMAGGGSSVYLSELILKDPYQPFLGKISLAGLMSRIFKQAALWVPRLGLFFDGMVWIYPGRSILFNSAGWIIFIFTLYGLAARFRKGQVAEAIFFITFLVLVCAWPFDESRFHFPLLPLALVFFFIGASNISGLITGKLKKPGGELIIMAGIWALIFLYQATVTGHIERRIHKELHWPSQPVVIKGWGTWNKPIVDWSRYEIPGYSEEALSYLTTYLIMHRIADMVLPEDAVILTRKPFITAFFSGRKATRIKFSHDYLSQWEHIQDEGVDYIMGGFSYRYLDRFVKDNRNYLEPVLESEYPELKLYQISSRPHFIFGQGEYPEQGKRGQP